MIDNRELIDNQELIDKRELTFYFDFISNNAYLGWTQLAALKEKYPLAIKPVPILFAGLLKAHNNVGPAEIPAKRDWMSKNILRKAALLGVEMKPPVHHPFNPLLPLRLCCAELDAEQQWQLIDSLFNAVWVEQQHISDPEVVERILHRLGIDIFPLMEQLEAGVLAEKLKHNTAGAVEQGAFGIPSMLIEDELFFGFDDIPYLEMWLNRQDPLNRKQLQQWQQANMRPSAWRSDQSEAQ